METIFGRKPRQHAELRVFKPPISTQFAEIAQQMRADESI